MTEKSEKSNSVLSTRGLTQLEEHKATVKAICSQIDKDSDLYKCLLNTKNTDEIEECFNKYSAARNVTAIGISSKVDSQPNNNLGAAAPTASAAPTAPTASAAPTAPASSLTPASCDLASIPESCNETSYWYKSSLNITDNCKLKELGLKPEGQMFNTSSPGEKPSICSKVGDKCGAIKGDITCKDPSAKVLNKCTNMKYNEDKQEFSIHSHPEISRFGVPNPLCPGSYMPDWQVQKHGIKVSTIDITNTQENMGKYLPQWHKDNKGMPNNPRRRCFELNEFDDKSKEEFIKNSNLYQDAVKQKDVCQNAFNAANCPAAKISEAFQNPNELPNDLTATGPDGTPISLSEVPTTESAQATVQPPPEPTQTWEDLYDISKHKQFKEKCMNYMKANNNNNNNNNNIGELDILQHPDINNYVLKTSIPAPKRCKKLCEHPITSHCDIKEYVHKDSIQQCKGLDEFDITKHPDIHSYVLKSSIPAPKRCKKLGEFNIEHHPQFAEWKKQMEGKCKSELDKFGTKDKCGNLKPCPNIDLNKYVLRSEVKPCPKSKPCPKEDLAKYGLKKDKCGKYTTCNDTYPNPADITQHPSYKKLLGNLGIKKDKCGKAKICNNPNPKNIRNHPDYGKLLRELQIHKDKQGKAQKCDVQMKDGCAANFVYSNNNATVENFEDVSKAKWDISYHKDFKNYIKKDECYAKFAKKDKCGKPIACPPPTKCKQLNEFNIEDHPDYEKVLLQYGALKGKCGKVIPAPKCPCIVKTKCGGYKYKPCPPQMKCPACEPKDKCEVKKVQTELVKSKIKLDILMRRYKESLLDKKASQAEALKEKRSEIRREFDRKKLLEKMREKYLEDARTKMESELEHQLSIEKKRMKKEMLHMKKKLEKKNNKPKVKHEVAEVAEVAESKVAKPKVVESKVAESKVFENEYSHQHPGQSRDYYSQHVQSRCSINPRNSVNPPRASSDGNQGWTYREPNHELLDDGNFKKYWPSGNNYRMLENFTSI